jgi:hypothetical protein
MPTAVPVATQDYAMMHVRRVRIGELAPAFPGLRVRRSPAFDGEPSGRVYDGIGIVMDYGNELGNLSVSWIDYGDRTTWTRASDGKFDVITLNAADSE